MRQLVEFVNDILTGQSDLEVHGGCSPAGAATRVAQRTPALTAAIWHSRLAAAPVTGSVVADDR